MGIKILPVEVEPLVKTNNPIAFPMSVIQGNNKNSIYWLASKFIGIRYNRWHRYFKLDMFTFQVPYFIFWKCLSCRTCVVFNRKKFLLEKIKRAINDGNYIGVIVNEYYNPENECYLKTNFLHDKYIYGYDDTKNVFKVLSIAKKGIYRTYDFDYAQFVAAFSYYFYNIGFLSFKVKKSFDFGIDSKIIKKSFNKYLSGKHDCGINCYDVLINSTFSDKKLNMRIFRPFLEHKKILCYIDDSFDIIKGKMEIVFNLAIKYNITKDSANLSKIRIILAELKIIEAELIKQYLRK